MSLNFLPTPVFAIIGIAISVALIHAAIKRRDKDRKGLLIVYITVSIFPILSIIIRLIKENTDLYSKYFNFFGYVIFIPLVLLIVELFWLSVTHNGSRESQRLIIFGWLLLIVPIVFGLIVFIFF